MTTITNTVFLLVTLGKPIKSENNWVLHCIWLLSCVTGFICYFSNAWHPTVYFKWLRISFIIHIYFILFLPLNLWSNNSNVTYLNWCLYNVFDARFNGAQCISQTDGIQIKLKISFWERKKKERVKIGSKFSIKRDCIARKQTTPQHYERCFMTRAKTEAFSSYIIYLWKEKKRE